MKPLSLGAPKEALPLGDLPVLGHVVRELVANGFPRVLLVSSPEKNFAPLNELFDAQNAQVATITQHAPLGLGHAVLQARDFAHEPFAIALGDAVLCRVENHTFATCRVLSRMRNAFETHDCAGVIAFQNVPREIVSRFGIAAIDEQLDENTFVLRDLIEKPVPDLAPSQFAVAARYLFAPSLFDALRDVTPDASGEIQLTSAIQTSIARGERVLGVTLQPNERRFDIGNPHSYAQAACEWALRENKTTRAWARELLEELT